MKKLAMAVAGAVLLVGLASKPAEAQVQFGANVVWGDDADFGVGARLGFPLGQALKDKGITALATFDQKIRSRLQTGCRAQGWRRRPR